MKTVSGLPALPSPFPAPVGPVGLFDFPHALTANAELISTLKANR